VPAPTTSGRAGSPPLRDRALLAWAKELLDAVVGDNISAAAHVSAATNSRHP
jgi:transcription-repair coupling factor (superfamily II helicase)